MTRETRPLDRLAASEYDELRGPARELVRRITDRVADHPTAGGPESGPKPGDVDDEQLHRTTYLRRVGAGQLTDALVNELIDECAAEDAADAVWLGASLADLGSVTGNSRQAARKRWPDLGLIYRTRRWVAGHHADLVTVIEQVLDHGGELTAADGQGETLDRAVPALRDALARTLRDRDSGSVVDPGTGRPLRWRHLAETVDVHLRTVARVGVPTTPAAATALAGAHGVLAYYDSVTAEPATATA
ncbi:hypothetical protein [Micromonospora sp. NBC_01796]|uniref:hypothetical protein n=1 Tax=Micromonospora sp. NBC_01796 TaxID=2975987 RepID=UPI002DDC0E4A|nr:hypothetical protein [Micromonospora sp. NBC_01796]WSA84900.1 hypothetical protein OIE47_31820 [Micromonospora sp. NBC_01796]